MSLFFGKSRGPAGILLLSFSLAICLGTAVLTLPVMQGEDPVGLLDCLFTATSAVCVTGLITVDTATAWSPWGQTVILVMLQLGGLGIMTFSVAMLTLVGRHVGLASQEALRGSLGSVPAPHLGRMAGRVLIYTLALEALGTGLLYLSFQEGHAPLRALGLAGFHAVSAFCNAGFSLFSDSLLAYRYDPRVTGVVMGLIILGGLGFLVLHELVVRLGVRRRGERPRRLSLHSRLVLWTSGSLVVIGAGLTWILEVAGEGGGTGFWDVVFTSVTARTAGFNTVEMHGLANGTLMLVCLLMFIGASPGSTGGGVKTTTFAAIYALARNRLRGLAGARVGHRSIAEHQVGEALTLAMGSIMVVFIGTTILVTLESEVSHVGMVRGTALAYFFEVVSAFGTVGLSMGVTPGLSPAGKLVIIILMFVGRLGPLTFVYALAGRSRKPSFVPAEEEIMLG